MAYFPNGSDTRLDEQCEECLHEDRAIGCPISFVSYVFNYDQVGNTNLRACLDNLVSETEGCLMRKHIIALKQNQK